MMMKMMTIYLGYQPQISSRPIKSIITVIDNEGNHQ